MTDGLGGAVQAQPLAAVVVVDGVEAARVGDQAEADDAAHGGEREVDDLPQPAGLVVPGVSALQLVRTAAVNGVEQPQEQILG